MVRSIRAIRLLCVAIGIIAMFAGNAYSSIINGSTIDVSGLGGTTKAVTVTLHNFSATKPSDVDLVVVGPTGAALVLMGGAAGTSQVGPVSVTFDDTAPANLISQHLTAGSFKPTQVGPIGSFPSPGPGLAYHSPQPADTFLLGNANAAGVFGGTTASTANPNGTWSLYAMDTVSGDSTDIAGGWSVNIQLNAPGGLSIFTNLSPIVIPAPPNPGDFNNDHHVNTADIQPAMTALTEPGGYELQYGISAADLQTIGDVNHDGKFNNADLLALLILLKTGGGSSNPVPEPSTLALLGLCVVGLLLRCRR
jgi:hypothetical protein